MSLTQEEIQEIRNFEKQIPSLFTGFIADDSLQGRSNTNAIFSYLIGRGLPFTVSNLTAAVVALQFTLIWVPGTEPVPVVAPSDNRTRAQKAVDGGINPYQPTQYNDAANGIESSWAKDVRLGKEKAAAQLAAKAKADLRFRETHQTVQGPNGRTSYAQSEALNKAAAQRHAQEDRAAGRPAPVAKSFRVIPEGTTDFTGYSAEELKAHLAKRKGRAGEPHGSLLR
jgi:hypothetical protein